MTAIDRYSYITASRFESHLFDYGIRVSYSRGELAHSPSELQHPVFRAALHYCGIEKDIELHTVADLPAFTGLGSSSSFTVALVQALHAYKGEFVAPLEIAREAIHIEREMLSENVGFQDQVAAGVGGLNLIEFSGKSEIRVNPLYLSNARLEELEQSLVLIYTGIKRRAADIEGRKMKRLPQNLSALAEMRKMAEMGAGILQSHESLDVFGHLMHDAWMAKRSLEPSVTSEDIDGLYKRGLDAGAWGGKLLGAGGGGFLLFVASPERRVAIQAAFPEQPALPFGIRAPGVGVIFAS